jgi:hypothetical protein
MTGFARHALAVCTLLCVACHHIKSDYPAYLQKHPASPALPHVPVPASYHIGESTQKHRLVIRSGTAGYGNKWIVEFGEMLEQTLQSAEVRAAFATLDRDAASPSGFELVLDLVDYQVSGFSAHIMLRARLSHAGHLLSDKIYSADGAPQAGKVAWGGAFSMRDALHETTKHALDVILRELLIDIERAATPVAAPVASRSDAVPAS